MSNEKEGNGGKADATRTQNDKPRKELTLQAIQRRKKMLVFPLLFLLFIGSMWLIFAPSGSKDKPSVDGFNPELPIPKDEVIVGDKRTAYEQEAMQNKQQEKRRSLQDFAFALGEGQAREEAGNPEQTASAAPDYQEELNNGGSTGSGTAIQSSTNAYQDINRQLNNWHEQSALEVDSQSRSEKVFHKPEEATSEMNAEEKQLELIEKSYAIAAKYMPNGQQVKDSVSDLKEKVIPKPVSQVHQSVVSLLAAPMENDEFLEQYGKPRNMGFITATGDEATVDKNSIRACVNQTVTLSNGKELQLRLREPMRAGDMLIPANTIMTGSAKIGGERLHITITSIQYAENVIPVEMEVYDMDGIQGIFVPNSDELNAMKEIAANSGTSMGSSITITDDAGSQLAADLGRSVIQGTSQFFSKKMREVKVTLKAGYKVLLLPKA